jgi:hypothetical protein
MMGQQYTFFKRHMERLFPEKVKELKAAGQWEDYLVANVTRALEMENRIEDQGVDPQMAREIAMQELMPRPPDEEDQPEEWEVEVAQEDVHEAVYQFLTADTSPRGQNLKELVEAKEKSQLQTNQKELTSKEQNASIARAMQRLDVVAESMRKRGAM